VTTTATGPPRPWAETIRIMAAMSSAPDSPTPAQSAEPSVLARVLAFASILLAGAVGGFIGWAFADLQCEGDCTVQAGISGLVVAIAAAVGVGVVAVLALRALGEWQAQKLSGADIERDPGLVLRRPDRPDTPPPSGKGRPRVQ
jgi:hypothetical protein